MKKYLLMLQHFRDLHYFRTFAPLQSSNVRDGLPGRSVRGERANFTRLVLGGGGGGRPDYLQKLKVPEGYEKMIDYSNI